MQREHIRLYESLKTIAGYMLTLFIVAMPCIATVSTQDNREFPVTNFRYQFPVLCIRPRNVFFLFLVLQVT